MTVKNKKLYRTIASLPEELWREVKVRAFKEGRFVYEWITEAIVEKLENEKEKK